MAARAHFLNFFLTESCIILVIFLGCNNLELLLNYCVNVKKLPIYFKIILAFFSLIIIIFDTPSPDSHA